MVYIYTNVQLCFNFIFIIILMIVVILKPKSFMCDLKINSKWVKPYVLILLILYVVQNFPQIIYTVMCIHPWLTIWGYTLLAANATTFAITWVAFNFMVSLKSLYASASQCQIKNTMELGLICHL
jgi:hypothetical protein